MCKHKWIKELDYWNCPLCGATKRVENGVVRWWDKDGNPMAVLEDGGEEAVDYVEKQLEEWRKK